MLPIYVQYLSLSYRLYSRCRVIESVMGLQMIRTFITKIAYRVVLLDANDLAPETLTEFVFR